MSSIRALIVEIHPFPHMAKLLAEDGCWLALTWQAVGVEFSEVQEGGWLLCDLAPNRAVLSAHSCPAPTRALALRYGLKDGVAAAPARLWFDFIGEMTEANAGEPGDGS